MEISGNPSLLLKHPPQILEQVLVSDYAAEGRSIARVDGKVIFISGAVPGDLVDVRIGKQKKDWAEGRVQKFHRYSGDRVIPFCSHFGVCGGCQWQMLPYSLQLLHKQKQVADCLERIGGISTAGILPILGALQTTRYRNKMEYTFSNRTWMPESAFDPVEGGYPSRDGLGFHLPGIFDKVLDLTNCHLQPDPGNAIRNCIRDRAIAGNLSFYDIKSGQGWLRNLVIRVTRSGELMVNLVLHHEDKPNREMLLDHILENFPAVTTLVYTINPKANDTLAGQPCIAYYGAGYITEQLGGFRFRIGPKSFFQTNSYQGEKLYEVVREFAGLGGEENVYDLYCGTGTIGIFVSPGARRVTGIELVEEAVEDARENARVNGIEKAGFLCGDVTALCNQGFFSVHGHPDVVIADPPRAGMTGKLIGTLLEIPADRIIYVSCNPATQARDLKLLSEKYLVNRVQPLDMFPHTQHIENVALLKRRQQ